MVFNCHADQIVNWLFLLVLLAEIIRKVQIRDREVDEGVDLANSCSRVLEALEVDDEDVGEFPEVDFLSTAADLLALVALPLF
jgi:hypothetical protein